jgi:hypothetical protein
MAADSWKAVTNIQKDDVWLDEQKLREFVAQLRRAGRDVEGNGQRQFVELRLVKLK